MEETESNVYSGVYYVLLGGMLVSSALFLIGIIRAMLHPQDYPLTSAWVRQQYHLHTVLHGLATFNPVTLMMVGTVLLILTPLARVVVSIHAFAVDRDHKYVIVTSIVLLVMILTVILGTFGLR